MGAPKNGIAHCRFRDKRDYGIKRTKFEVAELGVECKFNVQQEPRFNPQHYKLNKEGWMMFIQQVLPEF